MKDYSDTDVPEDEMAPDRRRVTLRQADHLAELSGVPAAKLAGRPIFELHDELKFKIDPPLLIMRKICGTVVKKNPVTGVIEGVPNATVHIEDTDCTFLGFFPVEGPLDYWWLWPLSCHREDLGTTRTDACGNFCVWIPRWDIDRLLRYRRERHCLPEVYKPTVGDILGRITREDPRKRPLPGDPNPPDPVIDRATLRQIGEHLGHRSLDVLAETAGAKFGESVAEAKQLLAAPAFIDGLRPPLSDDVLQRAEQVHIPMRDTADGELSASARSTIDLSPARAIGPFLRCWDTLVREWQTIVDVPDITFRVTQDVDSDGVEETIYSESMFDVRWNEGSIAPVTLVASPIALSTAICNAPVLSPCKGTAFIETVGLMNLVPQYHHPTTGYAVRPNAPAQSPGLGSSPHVVIPPGESQAPYAGALQLYGCHRIPGAHYYRMLLSDGVTTDVPMVTMPWWNPATAPGEPFPSITVAEGGCDALGWYPILAESRLAFPAKGMLFNWETGYQADGRYEIKIELADAGRAPLSGPARFSNTVPFHIDNSLPAVTIDQISWKVAGEATWRHTYNWPFTCIVITRPSNKDIEFAVKWGVTAKHLRNAGMVTGGCGDGTPSLLPPPPSTSTIVEASPSAATLGSAEHRWMFVGDETITRTTRYLLEHTHDQGSYSFGVDAYSRSFTPLGDGGVWDWLFDWTPDYVNPRVALSIIDGPTEP